MCTRTMLVILLFIAVASAQDTNGTRVKTTEGIVEGFTEDGVLAFYGIRYAGSISGPRRFMPAYPPPKIMGVFKAVEHKVCAQPTPQGMEGVEECLTLNVFTNAVNGSKPIIIWLEGEDYAKTSESPKYSFKSLVNAEVVVIAVNYRLSVFGFLCLGVEEAPGNAGLKDVIQALKWVKANAAAFGGDPNNVMLLGHGSGASMVDLITLSSQAKNLIHKAVAISGSAVAPWAVAFNPAGYAKAFAAKFNITDKNHHTLAKKLAAIKGDDLALAINEFQFKNESLLFAPCVENTKLPGSFLEDAPMNLIKAGKHLQIPYIAIYVGEEGTLRVKEDHVTLVQEMFRNLTDFLPVDLVFKNESTVKNDVSQKIWKHYLQKPETHPTTSALKFWGDTAITIPVIRGVRERAAKANNKNVADIYIMKFDYKETSLGDWPYIDVPLNGLRHGAILKYLFDVASPHVNPQAKFSLFNRIIAFAQTGNTTAPLNSPGDVFWPSVTSTAMNYMSISGINSTNINSFVESAMVDPEGATLKFWDDTASKYYAVPPRVTSSAGTLNVGFGLLAIQVLLRITLV